MSLKTFYVDSELMDKLLKTDCPLEKVCVQNDGRKVYYTLPPDDPNWRFCDAYYIPTADSIRNWLLEEKHHFVEVIINIDTVDDEEMYSWNIYYVSEDEISVRPFFGNAKDPETALLNGIKECLLHI